MTSKKLTPLILMSLFGCGGNPEDADSAPTFHKDVRAITESVCMRCHEQGGAGTYPLTTYDEVFAVRELVAASIADGTMPPWLAEDGCADYEDNYSLSDEERDLVLRWIDEGAPEGDEADAPIVTTPPMPSLTRVDHTLQLPEPYIPADADDDYRCFVLDWPDPAVVTSATGFTVVPDNLRVVHHLIAYIVPPEWADDYAAMDGEDGMPGYSCFGGPGGPADASPDADGLRWLAGWAPGGVGGDFPVGTGIPVEGGSKIILQMHYHPQPGEVSEPDQSSVQVMVDASIPMDNWSMILPFADEEWIDTDKMRLPASTNDVTHDVLTEVGEGFTVYSGNLHMHTKGKAARLAIEHADGQSSCLVDIKRWDFDWQRPYRLMEPVEVDPGDSISLSCTWDNSTANDVFWGDGTNDEMCLGTMYVTGR